MNSSQPSTDAARISPEQVSAFRLSRHHLVKRAPALALAQVAGDMAGGQTPPVFPPPKNFLGRAPGPPPGGGRESPWRGPRPPPKSGGPPGRPPPSPPHNSAL